MFPDNNTILPDESQGGAGLKAEGPGEAIGDGGAGNKKPSPASSGADAPPPAGVARNRKLILAVVLIVVLGGGAAGAYLYRDELRGTPLGRLIGLADQVGAPR